MDLWSANGQETPEALSDFAIVLTLANEDGPEVTVRVPVTADRVQVTQALAPPGWAFTAVAGDR